MAKLTREEVRHIALLARLGLSEDELEKFREQLSDILENFEILQAVNTDDVVPTAQVTGLENVMSDDEPQECLPQAVVLMNAPQEEDGFFRIKAVLD